jgi:hypothetical protein
MSMTPSAEVSTLSAHKSPATPPPAPGISEPQFVGVLAALSHLPEFDSQDVFAVVDKEQRGFVSSEAVAVVVLLLSCADQACMEAFAENGNTMEALCRTLAGDGWAHESFAATDASGGKDEEGGGGRVSVVDLVTLARACGLPEGHINTAVFAQGHSFEDSLDFPRTEALFAAMFATLEHTHVSQAVQVAEEIHLLPAEKGALQRKGACCVIL